MDDSITFDDITPADAKRFWSKVDWRLKSSTECWNWCASTTNGGYGQFSIRKRKIGSHRMAFLLVHKSLTPGLDICHTCDNRLCCNPDHLWEGTRAENLADMVTKERSARGERNFNSKIQERDIPRIYQMWNSGSDFPDIAKAFDVSISQLSLLFNRKIWKYVTRPKLHRKLKTGRIGEAHGRARLTEHDVIRIRAAHKRGVSYAALARHFGVTSTTIRDAALGKTWSHVETRERKHR